MVRKDNRIFGLDILRAIAILLVVQSHLTFLLWPNLENTIITASRAFGAIGVDLFFVLSGFLIGGILLRGINDGDYKFKNLLNFWKRRWLRTLPNYYVMLLLNLLLFYFLNDSLPDKISSYFVFIQNFTNSHPDFFTEAWSLSIEEYAYLLLPAVLFLLGNIVLFKRPKKIFLYVLFAFLFFSFLLKISFYNSVSIESYKQWSSLFRKVVIYRIDSIYWGFLLVYLYKSSFWLNENKNKLFVFGLLLFTVLHLLLFVYKLQPQTSLAFYVFVYLTVLIISLGLLFPFFINLKKPNKAISYLVHYVSTRSYSIYLVNYSIVLLSLEKFKSLFANQFMLLILFVVFTLVFSELLYRFVEVPFLKFRDKKLNE